MCLGIGYLKGPQANISILSICHQARRLSQPRSLADGTQDSRRLILEGAALAGPVIPSKLRFLGPRSLGTNIPQGQSLTGSGPITGHTEHCPRFIYQTAGSTLPGQMGICRVRGRKRTVSQSLQRLWLRP